VLYGSEENNHLCRGCRLRRNRIATGLRSSIVQDDESLKHVIIAPTDWNSLKSTTMLSDDCAPKTKSALRVAVACACRARRSTRKLRVPPI
jgi:hypothetical protein